MDKQFKLTDRVSKDSIKSPIFKKWVKRILCIASIFSLALQLTLCCMPMNASAAESDSVVGEWIINSLPTNYSVSTGTTFNVNGTFNSVSVASGSTISSFTLTSIYLFSKEVTLSNGISTTSSTSSEGRRTIFDTSFNGYSNIWYCQAGTGSGTGRASYFTNASEILRTVIITGGTDVNNPTLVAWFNANATRVYNTVYDFTGETRIFKDELTLFNTSDATWTEAFSFNFEVLGVGTADYITLQRTVQNNYTMSYSFDFEDSGGLTMIYRDSPPFDNGEAEWLGGKVNRKVITFLTNPEDPEFQQWLLDNTTLFDNVKDAYQLGQQSGYNNGYEEGFANSLIGDSLSGPINALSQITLIEIQGTAITLGGVVMTAIALCLVLAFLKLYAGG